MTQDMNQGGSFPPDQPIVTTSGGGIQGGFPIGDMIKEAWEIFKVNALILIGGILIMAAIIIGANSFTFGLAGIVLQGPLMLGYYIVILRLVRKQPVEFGNLFDGFKQFLPAFLANLLVSIFTAIGLILCILPGLFVALMYILVYFYIHDKQMDFWPAMEASRQRIMENVGPWIILWLVFLGLNILGSLACGIGVLITGPLTFVMVGLAYKKIEG